MQIMRPRLRRSLQSTWEALKSWEESQPASFRAPMPLALLAAMVCSSRIRADSCASDRERVLWFTFSALLFVGFFGLLRPGELLSIAGRDVSLPNSLTMGSCFAVVKIARPKNARQMGVQQFIEVRHPDAINWLSWLKATHLDDRPFWQSTSNRFAICSSRFVALFRLVSCSFLPPLSVRGLVDEGLEINRIRFSGRWAHLRSLEHYIQVARA